MSSGGYSSTKVVPECRIKRSDKILSVEAAVSVLGQASIDEIRSSWSEMDSKGYGQSNYKQANGIIQNLIDQGLSNRQIKGALGSVGNGRIDRIRRNPIQVSRNGFKPPNAFSDDDLGRIKVFIG